MSFIAVIEETHDPANNGVSHGHHLRFFGPFVDMARGQLFLKWAQAHLEDAVNGRVVEIQPEPVAFVLSVDGPSL